MKKTLIILIVFLTSGICSWAQSGGNSIKISADDARYNKTPSLTDPLQFASVGMVNEFLFPSESKEQCVAATTASITLSGEQSIDGYDVVSQDRVLVKNQTNSYENGVYEVGVPWVRVADMNTWVELYHSSVFISHGIINSGSIFSSYMAETGTLGADPIIWNLTGKTVSQTLFGTGSSLSGYTLSLSGSDETVILPSEKDSVYATDSTEIMDAVDSWNTSVAKGITAQDTAAWNAGGGGSGDMVLASSQSVTGLKTFDKDKFSMKGTSTGTTVLSTANASASNYTATLPAATGTIAYTSDITGTNSGTNTGDNATNTQYSGLVTNATHTGDVTGSGALTIAEKAVTLAKMNDMATASFIGRNSASTGVPEVLSTTTVKSMLGLGTAAYTASTTYATAAQGTTADNAATKALNNLASVAINSALIPATAGALDLGSTTKPWGSIWFSGSSATPGTNQFKFTGNSSSGVRTITLPNRSVKVDSITTSTTTAGTGFLKGNGSAISFDNSTYLTSVGTGVANELTYWSGTNTLGSLATATYPTLTELAYIKGVTSGIQSQLNSKGAGDMILSSIQSVTGLKTFDKNKFSMKGTSTGTTVLSTANASASNYTATLPAATGTIAYTSDIPSTTNLATKALDNLASVAINSALIPATAGALDLGSTTKPWGSIWFSGSSATPGTNQFKFTGNSSSGVRTITLPNRSVKVDSITTSTTTAGTGFLKGNGSAISFDNSTYLTSVTAHNLLSSTHGDATAGTVTRGDVITGQGSSPKWTKLALGTTGKVLISNGTDLVYSTNPLGTAAYTESTAYLPITGGAVNAGGSNGTTLTSQGTVQTTIRLHQTDAPLNQKFFEFLQTSGGAFSMRFLNDAYSASSNFMDVTRSTNSHVVSSVRFPNGNVSIGDFAPTAALHIKAGTASAGMAPLKLTSGVNLTTPEAGAIEFDGTNLFYTNSTPTRKTIATTDVATTSVAGLQSAADKLKLDAIQSGAEVNVQANWSTTNSALDSYILNKPDFKLDSDSMANSGYVSQYDLTGYYNKSQSDTRYEVDTMYTRHDTLFWKQNGVTHYSTNAGTVPAIGDFYAGGYVFYVDPSNSWGLCASSSYVGSTYTWNLGSESSLGTGTTTGTGNNNTSLIVTSTGAGTYAAKIAYDLSLNGYSDWYLPSKDELGLIRTNLHASGIHTYPTTTYYWSSSENTTNAWYQDFATGTQGGAGRCCGNSFRIIAVRTWILGTDQTVPTGANGDILYSNAGSWTALPIGSSGQVLKVASGLPSWGAVTGTGTVTSVGLTAPTGLTVSGSPITSSGTLGLSLTSGYSIPTTANQTNWTAGYNDKIASVAVTGTTTKTVTLTQQDGGTVSTTFTDQTGTAGGGVSVSEYDGDPSLGDITNIQFSGASVASNGAGTALVTVPQPWNTHNATGLYYDYGSVGIGHYPYSSARLSVIGSSVDNDAIYVNNEYGNGITITTFNDDPNAKGLVVQTHASPAVEISSDSSYALFAGSSKREAINAYTNNYNSYSAIFQGGTGVSIQQCSGGLYMGSNASPSLTNAGFFSPVSSTDAAAPNNTIYYSTTASKLVYKDSGGTVHALY